MTISLLLNRVRFPRTVGVQGLFSRPLPQALPAGGGVPGAAGAAARGRGDGGTERRGDGATERGAGAGSGGQK
jgi:hypothetical protein